MKIPKIEQQSLNNLAYTMIKELILNNILKPGSKIKQEEMAQQLGISRAPLRLALTRLEAEGLVVTYPRRGFFVKNISKEELSEVLGIRTYIEIIGIDLLIDNINENIKNSLLQFLKEFEAAFNSKNEKKYFEIDRRFHHYLVEATGNKALERISTLSNIQVSRYLIHVNLEASLRDHKELIDCILNSKPKEAEQIIKEHLRRVEDYLNSKSN
jgi:DNA-binding GntR family transcriptional regulator